MSAIPSSAMPHAFAEEGENLRDPHGGTIEQTPSAGPSAGMLIGGAALLAFVLYRALR